jgi:hypothetical protein
MSDYSDAEYFASRRAGLQTAARDLAHTKRAARRPPSNSRRIRLYSRRFLIN